MTTEKNYFNTKGIMNLEKHYIKSINNKDLASRKVDFENINNVNFIPYLSIIISISIGSLPYIMKNSSNVVSQNYFNFIISIAIFIYGFFYFRNKIKKTTYCKYFYIDTFHAKKKDEKGMPIYDKNLPFKEN